MVVPNQGVEAATKLSAAFIQGSSDGLIGLAFGGINTASPRQVKTLVDNMIEQNLIKDALFTVKIDKGDSDGFFTCLSLAKRLSKADHKTVGYIEEGITPNPFTYIPIDNSAGFWQFNTKSFTVSGKVHQREQGAVAIADTGTTLVYTSDDVVDAIYAAVPGARFSGAQGGYLVPSNAVGTLPPIGFEVNGQNFVLPGSWLAFTSVGGGMHFGSIQSRGQNDQDIWVRLFTVLIKFTEDSKG